MGLGLFVTASREPKGLLGRRRSRSAVLRSIADAIRAAVTDPLLARCIQLGLEGDRLEACLHPAEEPVHFAYDETGPLLCEARTNGGGPGYHAFVVELLEQVGKQCGVVWEWQTNEGSNDETGFHEHRDFRRLQQEMLVWLQALATNVMHMAEEVSAPTAIGLPIDCPLPRDVFAASMLGPRSREWFASAAALDWSQDSVFGPSFFAWWHRERDAEFWKKTGLALAWTRLPWHTPATDEERDEYQFALDCFARARALDASIVLPEAEIAEIGSLLGRPGESDAAPAPAGIGYRRGAVRFPLAQGWSIELPGYYYTGTEDNGQTEMLWFGDRTVRVTALQISDPKVGPVPAGDLLASFTADQPIGGDLVQLRRDHLVGVGSTERAEEDGEAFWQFTGYCAAAGRLAIVSITFTDPADREWATATWQTVNRPADRGTSE